MVFRQPACWPDCNNFPVGVIVEASTKKIYWASNFWVTRYDRSQPHVAARTSAYRRRSTARLLPISPRNVLQRQGAAQAVRSGYSACHNDDALGHFNQPFESSVIHSIIVGFFRDKYPKSDSLDHAKARPKVIMVGRIPDRLRPTNPVPDG